ncbi:hypothetical protein EVG20_g8574 [Dentipellis fragilis]|uniref:Uncharacterized protein n=1 Tax=Dentipellis fragilis TaxID=205917 RepID=A0A4Y9Y634_9AGAM|nr:hypothetical protein EVG20_g8574 [Dentipellis fragilis]
MSQYYQYPSYNGQPQAYQYTQPYYQPQQQQYGQQPMAQYAAAVPFPAGYTSPAVQQVQMPAPQPQGQRTQTPYPARRHTTSNHHHNSNSGAASKPLKPAIRKVERSKTAAAAIAVNRSRTTSGGDARPRLESLSRTRTNSSVRVEPGARIPPREPRAATTPGRVSRIAPYPNRSRIPTRGTDHIFLSISAPNDIDVSNIAYKSTIEELNQVISAWCASSWSPGPPREMITNNHWHAHFSGGPWNMRPQDAVK